MEHRDFHSDLFDVCCAECDRMILVVPYPTVEETRTAASAGSERAAADLPGMKAQQKEWEAWHRLVDETMLRQPAERGRSGRGRDNTTST